MVHFVQVSVDELGNVQILHENLYNSLLKQKEKPTYPALIKCTWSCFPLFFAHADLCVLKLVKSLTLFLGAMKVIND